MKKFILPAMAALMTITMALPAHAQSNKRRIEALEQSVQNIAAKLQTMDSQIGYDPVTGAYTDSPAAKLNQLESSVAQLRGQVESLTYKQQQQDEKIEALTRALQAMQSGAVSGTYESPNYGAGSADNFGGPTDLNNQSGSYVTPEPAQPQQTYQAAPQTQIAPSIAADPATAYDNAFNALLVADYGKAEGLFAGFLDTYPDDYRAPDAQFRLGEIYLATNENNKAAKAFLNHIKSWPDDARSKEAYLKLGTAFQRLNKNPEACKIYGALQNKYSALPVDIAQRLRIEKQKAGCN